MGGLFGEGIPMLLPLDAGLTDGEYWFVSREI